MGDQSIMSSSAIHFIEGRAMPSTTKTLTLDVYERLRHDIRGGNLTPAMPLRVDWLRKKYEVGATPLREALSRLAAEYLVTTEGKRGFSVAPVSLVEFRELTSLRDYIDRHALEMAILQGDDEWESAIVARFHLLSKAPRVGQSNDPEAVAERSRRHNDFHIALIAGCESKWLMRIWLQMTDLQGRYWLIATRDVPTPDDVAQEIDDEHRAIMELVLARKAKEAIEMLSHHQRRTIASVEAWAKANGL